MPHQQLVWFHNSAVEGQFQKRFKRSKVMQCESTSYKLYRLSDLSLAVTSAHKGYMDPPLPKIIEVYVDC
jgi:hypothetical protein